MQNHIERQIMMMGQEVAKLYQGGLYEKALFLAMRCCELAKQYIGKNHPHYVTCLNNIAEIYRAMGRYAEAEPIYIEALEITRRNAGPTNPFVTRTLNNYAALKYNMSNYKEAASLYQEALQILRINRI